MENFEDFGRLKKRVVRYEIKNDCRGYKIDRFRVDLSCSIFFLQKRLAKGQVLNCLLVTA
ncbi:MAG: hypothetical protein AABZ11_07970 [Nitrospinota bacterium]